MNEFARLFATLDQTTSTNRKVQALADYFQMASPADAAWAVYFLSGRKLKRQVTTTQLRDWVCRLTGTPEWMFAECYGTVGDLAETMALLLPRVEQPSTIGLAEWVEQQLLPMASRSEADRRETILQCWKHHDSRERFIINKLLTGGWRVGVSQSLVVKALAIVSGKPVTLISHQLMGTWKPNARFFQDLLSADASKSAASQPYPFCLAHPLDGQVTQLGAVADWCAEWKWDGIRAQAINRGGEIFIWSRGEELITERYPEVQAVLATLPSGTVLDGELLAWNEQGLLPFAALQKRLNRKSLTRKLLQEVSIIFMAYDILEYRGLDYRERPFHERRSELEQLIASHSDPAWRISRLVEFASWEDLTTLRQKSRERGVEGFMLKRRASPYRVGRVRGDWWKWKVEPLTMDAVLTAAQRGHGQRAQLYTDYTFSVWDGERLVTIAKAYSGLTNAEIREVDRFIRENTLEKFGPVRTVKPELVFELAFEGIQVSTRHKAGLAVRFPRILRQRTDKKAAEADTLDRLRQLLPGATP